MHPLVGRLSLVSGRPDQGERLAAWPAAGVALVWMVATSLVPLVVLVLVGWLSSGLLGGLADPFRLATNIWLAAHGVPLDVTVGSVTMHPLALTVLVIAVLWRGGRWAGRRTQPRTLAAAGRLTALLAGGYGTATALLAIAGTGPAARPDVEVAAGAGALLAAVVSGLGVLSGADLLRSVRDRIPLVWRVAIDSGVGATLVLVGLAALLLAGMLVVRRDMAYDLAAAVGPDRAGWPLLLTLNVLLVPNAVLAALAYATGPGFAVGVGTSVTLDGSQIGALPPLSLLAAVPGSAEPHAATYAVLAIPLIAGIAAGLLAVRRSRTLRPELCALAGLGAGAVTGILSTAATWAASGGLGNGQLASVGPTGWMVGTAVGLEVGAVAAATAWIGCPRVRSNLSSALLPSTVPESESPDLTIVSTVLSAQVQSPSEAMQALRQPDEPTVALVRPPPDVPAGTLPDDPPVQPAPAADGSEPAGDAEETVVLKRQTG